MSICIAGKQNATAIPYSGVGLLAVHLLAPNQEPQKAVNGAGLAQKTVRERFSLVATCTAVWGVIVGSLSFSVHQHLLDAAHTLYPWSNVPIKSVTN